MVATRSSCKRRVQGDKNDNDNDHQQQQEDSTLELEESSDVTKLNQKKKQRRLEKDDADADASIVVEKEPPTMHPPPLFSLFWTILVTLATSVIVPSTFENA
jgi:hypothetical protein